MTKDDSSPMATWADANGYGPSRDHNEQQIKSIGSKTSGLYLLEFENRHAYVGISVDIKARLKQHAVTYSDIASVRLRPENLQSADLRKIERQLVHSAEQAGLTLRNREHASVIIGKTSLDDIVSVEEQAAWQKNPAATNRADVSTGVTYTEGQLAAHLSSFTTLEAHPRFEDVVKALGLYLDLCVPFPLRTEGTFWTVSCYPGSSKSLLLRVSMAMLETLYIWANPKSGKLEVHMFVDGHCLPPAGRLSRSKPWRKLSKHVQAGPRGHVSAGGNERTVVVDDIAYVGDALAIPGVAQAAATHALSVMRKRQSGYKPSHCPQLASAATAAIGLVSAKTPTVPAQQDLPSEEVKQVLPSVGVSQNSPESEAKVDAFFKHDTTGVVLNWLADLVGSSLPSPEFDAGVHWGLTCMPSTSAGKDRKRLFTLNVGQIEVAYAIVSTRPDDAPLSGAVVLSASALEERTGQTIEQLVESHPRLTFSRVNYVAAQGDDINVTWAFDDESLSELNSLPWRESSASLVDFLRVSRCPYGKHHSAALMTEVVTAR